MHISALFRLARLAVFGLLLLPVGAIAQDRQNDDIDPAIIAKATSLFSSFCIDAFPDNAKIDALAEQSGGERLTSAELARYLGQNPGRGWYFHTDTGLYLVTIEAPPFRACAMRRMTPVGFNSVTEYIADVKAYVARMGRHLVSVPGQHAKGPDGISDISAFPYGVADANGRPTDTFAVILTNYHFHPPAGWEAEVKGGLGKEVRYVHQLVGP